jgi:AraC family transcriptional regulator of adaptative response/methylated-DNA-[protein]-cysteine methyltransferase
MNTHRINQSLPDQETMLKAFYAKDSTYEGAFYVGVRTTGIFCRPTCTAKKPRPENIEFFPSTQDALLHGFRPCKICRPLGKNGEVPGWLHPLLSEINNHPDERFKDSDLRERGLDPNRVRRWFKKNHGITFVAFQRLQRISQAFHQIQHGSKVIEAAYDAGYESLSGFTHSFHKQTGFSPNQSRRRNMIFTRRILTPLGPMLAAASDEGICLLEFTDRRMLETQLNRIRKRITTDILPGNNSHLDVLEKQLNEYFAGKRKLFSLPLVLSGTPFQEKVWSALLDIPYGETRSYKQQAQAIGQPEAVRAVARANGDNRIAIIIPCHRVIGSDGQLVGYGGGLFRKQYLLSLETSNS